MKPARTLCLMSLAAMLTIALSASQAGRPPQAAPATSRMAGVAMDPTKPIAANAAAAANLTTLVSAAKSADLITTLSGPGPYTLFAPDNAAFGRLAPGTMDMLLKPENKPALAKMLAYHVVPGTITLQDLTNRIKAGNGATTLTTVEGEPITVTSPGGAIQLIDVNGNTSFVETPDLRQSNGVVFIVNGVLIPKLG